MCEISGAVTQQLFSLCGNFSTFRNLSFLLPSVPTIQRWCNKYLWSARLYAGEGNGNWLQYSCLGNPMDGGAWWAAVHRVMMSRTQLSDFTFTFHFHALEKERATHSSVLAWRIPGRGEPGGLPSMGSHRVGHNWSDLAAAAAAAADSMLMSYLVNMDFFFSLFLPSV